MRTPVASAAAPPAAKWGLRSHIFRWQWAVGDRQLRLVHEVSESDVGAMAGGSGQRGAHIYAGPADRANQAAAGYLRNQSFSFPSMLVTLASPAQQQLMQTAPRVRA